jgi:hypothetical protein
LHNSFCSCENIIIILIKYLIIKYFNNYLININNLYNEIKNNENIYYNKSYEIFMPKNIIKKEIEYLGITQNIAIIHDNTKI